MLTHEKTSYFNNFFTCLIENNNIFQTDYLGNRIEHIGVSISKYNELKKICDTYYNKLVELGAIEKERTPQEIAREQTQMMSAMMEQMKLLQTEINSLKEKSDVQSADYNINDNKSSRVQQSTGTKSK